MTKKKADYTVVENGKYQIFLDRANAFFKEMFSAYSDDNWYSVGLEAVHCAISISDAILAKKFGIRCMSKDHRDIIALLEERLGEKAKEQTATLSRIINMKNKVEYDDRIFTPKEAEEIFMRTERYFKWAKSIIG